ncbi:MAG: hypothetical protein U1E05_21255, partial [Patescibacteria group bacterium]|nr:hypothetical protein [Patescibacteria group bacterium]
MNTHATAECPPPKPTSLAASYRPSRPADVERLGRGGRAVRRILPVLFRTVVSLALIAGGIGVVVLLGKTKPPATQDAAARVYPVVEVVPITEHAGGIDFEVHGVVVPFRQVEMPAEVAGTIAFRSDNCRVGRTVVQG